MVDSEKVMKVIKIVALILLVILLVEIKMYGLENCDKCKFEWEDKELNTKQFMSIYSENCFESSNQSFLNTSPNLSLG